MVKRKHFTGSGMNWLREVPREELWTGDSRSVRRRECRQMKSLVNVASSVIPAFMLVQKRATRREIKQRQAGQKRQCPPRLDFAENGLRETHASFRLHSTVPF